MQKLIALLAATEIAVEVWQEKVGRVDAAERAVEYFRQCAATLRTEIESGFIRT